MKSARAFHLSRRLRSGWGKGFTLIEVLVVIAVIVLLMAILLPVLQRVRAQARAVVCRSNLRQWNLVLAAYTTAAQGQLHNQGFCEIAWPEFWMYWLGRRARDTAKMRCCPMAKRPAVPSGGRCIDPRVTGGRYTAWGRFKPYIGTHQVASSFYQGSYTINSWLSAPSEQEEGAARTRTSVAQGEILIGAMSMSPEVALRSFWKTTDVKGAANVPAFADSWWWCTWPKANDEPPETEESRQGFPCGCRNSMQRLCIDRHNGYINIVFLDGSVRKVGIKETWTLKWHRLYNTSGPWTQAGGVTPDKWPAWMRRFKDY